MFADKFSLLRQEVQDAIYDSAKKDGPSEAARNYYQEAGMNVKSLENKLRRYLRRENIVPETNGKSTSKFVVKKTVRLTPSEKDLLKNLKEGTATVEDASRIVAAKVFEKMLKNPDDFRFIDFFRTELLKIKQQEVNYKENWASEMINRLFAGKLPPRECPKCHFELVKLSAPILEGKVLNESIPVAGDL